MANKIYPESKIELTPVILKHYDRIMNSISFGKYHKFIVQAVEDMDINEDDHILDLGCGSGKNATLMSDYLNEKGRITGVDLSPIMERQFLAKHKEDKRISFSKQRIDIPFDLEKLYDKVVISFVIHGFPHEVRQEILRNAYKHLKPNGKLIILDFSEFKLSEMPWHHRFVFKKVECVYAFDYIERDWRNILFEFGFIDFKEKLYFRKYARLLNVSKN
ncbi:class I SAM-dependent methyltransferase [Bacteroidota bacterium]